MLRWSDLKSLWCSPKLEMTTELSPITCISVRHAKTSEGLMPHHPMPA